MRHKRWKSLLLSAVVAGGVLVTLAPPAAADETPVDTSSFESGVTVDIQPKQIGPVGPNARSLGPTDSCTTDGDITICVEIGTTRENVSLTPGAATNTAKSIIPFPSWCLVPSNINNYLVTRTEMCGIEEGKTVIQQTTNGTTTVIGTMDFLVYNWVYTSASWNTFVNQIRVSPITATGAAVGTQISGVASCLGSACNQTSQSFPAQTPPIQGNADGEVGYQWTGASGEMGYATPSWSLTFKAPQVAKVATMGISAPTQVRCDNALPGVNTIGCVLPFNTPGIFYDSTSFIEFGKHVAGAQASGLRGATDANPLHRLVNKPLQDLNRDKSCPANMPRPTGKSCDEYPFSSSYEGAYLSGGGARTQSWCGITLTGPGSTGPAGFSVCMINAAENSAAGSLLNSKLFVPSRVLDADAFRVVIV